MSEQELKLHVPPTVGSAIEQELRKRAATRVRLHALYFDTPDRELARARVALRLRREGSDWVQTLKMPGGDAITRMELNHPRPGPVLDLSVYAGTPAEDALASLRGELGLRYETDVQRVLCKVRSRFGSVEIAYDTGILRAGDLELPISEVEFELMSGRVAAIFAVARTWQQRHGLILDTRSKSHRGDALAALAVRLADKPEDGTEATAEARRKLIAGFWGTRGASNVKLAEDMDAPRALGAIAAECLEQVIHNAAMLAEVDTAGIYKAGHSEHVHQLRVGIRRLRSAWRLFDGWTAPVPEALLDGVRTHFAAFGANRDQDVLDETVAPMLQRAGMPVIPHKPAAPDEDSYAIASGRAFQGWLLDMLEWSLDIRPAPLPAVPATPLVQSALATTLPDAAAAAQSADNGATDGTTAQGIDSAAAGTQPADEPSAPIIPTIIPLRQPEPPQAPPALRTLLSDRLHRWHKKVVNEGKRFTELEIEARHDLRKRAKRLRYGLSFAESLLPAARLQGYRKLLAQVQDLLGEFNDLAVAREHYENCVNEHPQAWFALGWIGARLDALAKEAQDAFDQLAHAKAFWK
ncbi:CYTH and CHAD domain-containing protein [Bordetella genomosp. 13]|uniref:CYTH and CHAD domain-containing protein n=1 Tax=Bordetella genomosp. 13 TaxID=463040 RepID=UPI00119E6231|nr:CYTH and CHAD domain-containing protein [Bordetella genomosp. 13]